MLRTLARALLVASVTLAYPAVAQVNGGSGCTASSPCPVTVQGTGSFTPGPTTATSTNGGAQTAFSTNTITTTNTYQQVVAAGSCTHGGIITDTSTPGVALIYVNQTSGITAGATSIGNGYLPIASPAVSGGTGGYLTILPTVYGIFVYGPSGATFSGFCS